MHLPARRLPASYLVFNSSKSTDKQTTDNAHPKGNREKTSISIEIKQQVAACEEQQQQTRA